MFRSLIGGIEFQFFLSGHKDIKKTVVQTFNKQERHPGVWMPRLVA
jgi:hypothetical protein